MEEKMIRSIYDPNSSYSTPYQTDGNISVVPQQISSRPNTLPINGSSTINSSFFTPTDYSKFSLSTPDLINVLANQPTNEGTPSPGAKVLEEIFVTHMNDMNNQPMPLSDYSYAPMIQRQQQQQQHPPPISNVYPHPSSMHDNDSSNSTTPSSPLSIKRTRDELQHVPTLTNNMPIDQREIVRKEKKRERNRQAAQKCRTRKLTRIAELQKRVNELQGKNKNLTNIAENLQSDIVKLEKQLHDHHNHGCALNNGSTF